MACGFVIARMSKIVFPPQQYSRCLSWRTVTRSRQKEREKLYGQLVLTFKTEKIYSLTKNKIKSGNALKGDEIISCRNAVVCVKRFLASVEKRFHALCQSSRPKLFSVKFIDAQGNYFRLDEGIQRNVKSE